MGRIGPGRRSSGLGELADRASRGGVGEAPVEERAGITAVGRFGTQQGNQQRPPVPASRSDKGRPSGDRVAVLHPDRAPVGAEQVVVILDLERRAATPPQHRPRDRQVTGHDRVAQRGSPEHRQVVRGCCLTGGVEAGGVPGDGVARTEGSGEPVHPVEYHLGATGSGDESDSRVVAAGDEHRHSEVTDGVPLSGDQSDLRTVDPRSIVADQHQLLGWQLGQHGQRCEDLHCGSGQVTGVRVAGREDVPGVGVGQQPGPGRDTRWQVRRPAIDADATRRGRRDLFGRWGVRGR